MNLKLDGSFDISSSWTFLSLHRGLFRKKLYTKRTLPRFACPQTSTIVTRKATAVGLSNVYIAISNIILFTAHNFCYLPHLTSPDIGWACRDNNAMISAVKIETLRWHRLTVSHISIQVCWQLHSTTVQSGLPSCGSVSFTADCSSKLNPSWTVFAVKWSLLWRFATVRVSHVYYIHKTLLIRLEAGAAHKLLMKIITAELLSGQNFSFKWTCSANECPVIAASRLGSHRASLKVSNTATWTFTIHTHTPASARSRTSRMAIVHA